jgi:kexin
VGVTDTAFLRGETGIGKWTITIKDNKVNEYDGFWVDWRLKLWGESIDPEKATKLPMPVESDDTDGEGIATTTAQLVPQPTVPPTDSGAAAPDASGGSTQENEKPSGSAGGATPSGTSVAEQASTTHWVSWLPSFGVSSKAQIWIYGAMGLIGAFCIGLGIYLYIARRKRLQNDSGDDYEFEPLAEDVDGYDNGEKGSFAPGAQSRRTRGGELYDAFAGGSEDEDEDFEDPYQDSTGEQRPLGPGGSGRVSVGHEAQHVIGDDESDDEGRQGGGLLGSAAR